MYRLLKPFFDSRISTQELSNMATKKIITVFGATGRQGGSVIRCLLTDPKTFAEYHIRAVTRDIFRPAAQQLKKQGVEVVLVCIMRLYI